MGSTIAQCPAMLDAPTVVTVADRHGVVLSSQRTGYAEDEDCVGRPLESYLSPASRPLCKRAIHSVVEYGQPVVCKLRTLKGRTYVCEFARLPRIGDRQLVSVNAWKVRREPDTADTKYVGVDIVGYSDGRCIEAQADVIAALNDVVRAAVNHHDIPEESRLFIPTGDGLFIALLDLLRPYDIHVRIAVKILEYLDRYNRSQLDPMRRFDLRIAVNESIDTVVTDVNGSRNVAGDGINVCSRILDLGDGGNILVGERVHQRLRCHETYVEGFRTYRHTVKHGLQLSLFQLVATGLPFVNEEVPRLFAHVPPLERTTIQRANRLPDLETSRDLCRELVVN